MTPTVRQHVLAAVSQSCRTSNTTRHSWNNEKLWCKRCWPQQVTHMRTLMCSRTGCCLLCIKGCPPPEEVLVMVISRSADDMFNKYDCKAWATMLEGNIGRPEPLVTLISEDAHHAFLWRRIMVNLLTVLSRKTSLLCSAQSCAASRSLYLTGWVLSSNIMW